MKFKKILVVLMAFVTIFCTAMPAFAYGYSGYGTPASGSGVTSPYGTPAGPTDSSPYEIPVYGSGGLSGGSGGISGGTSTSGGTSGSAGSGVHSGGMPGSGTPSGSAYGSEMPGSGTGSPSPGGTGGTYPGSGFGGSSVGGSSVSGAAGDKILDASIASDGSVILSVPTASGTGGNLTESVSYALQKYKNIGTAIFGICTITSIICMLWQITKLGAAGDNQRSRFMAVKGILISGAALAVFGSVTLVAGIFWGAFL